MDVGRHFLRAVLSGLFSVFPLLGVGFLAIVLSACGPSLQTKNADSESVGNEPAYCGSAQAILYSGLSTTVNGTAN